MYCRFMTLARPEKQAVVLGQFSAQLSVVWPSKSLVPDVRLSDLLSPEYMQSEWLTVKQISFQVNWVNTQAILINWVMAFYTPETKFGGVYRSHPVVGRLVGRSSGPLRFLFPIQLHTMIKHMERKCSAQEK